MRSAAVLDRGSPRTSDRDVEDLLVLWQHPDTREIVPIGRFARRGRMFSFSYTRAAEEVDGFRPLPGLEHLHSRYEGDRIPAVFDQRVMSPDRPDYREYLSTLGLDAAQATPWEQIVESGGNRAGDSLQFMQMPHVVDGRAHARFLANGMSHIPEGSLRLPGREVSVTRGQQEQALHGLQMGDSVLLEPELDNPFDPFAVLLTLEGVPLGWVPRALSASFRELMATEPIRVVVHRVGGQQTPYHLRLALDLDVPAPVGFAFDRDGRWAPLAG